MFFTFIWFIFIAYSVSGYHKTFLTCSNIYKCSMKVIIVQWCGQPPLCPIWQLIRVAKVVHLKAIEQPPRTFFVSCFPRQWQQQQQQHLHAHTTHEQWHGIPHQQEGHMTYRNVNGATTMATQTNGAQSPRWSKVQHSMAGGQQGRRIGTGLSEEWGNTFVHIYVLIISHMWPMSVAKWPMSGP